MILFLDAPSNRDEPNPRPDWLEWLLLALIVSFLAGIFTLFG